MTKRRGGQNKAWEVRSTGRSALILMRQGLHTFVLALSWHAGLYSSPEETASCSRDCSVSAPVSCSLATAPARPASCPRPCLEAGGPRNLLARPEPVAGVRGSLHGTHAGW